MRAGRPIRVKNLPRSFPRRPGEGAFVAAALAAAFLCAGPVSVETPARAAEPPAPPSTEAAPSATPSPAIEEALALADRLIAAGQPVAAFAVLMETLDALPEDTDDAPLRFGIAQALMAGGRLAQAEQVLAQLAEERPANLRIRLDRAAALFALGRDDEAGEVFRAVRRAPDLPPETRRKVEGFLARLLIRQRLRFDLDLGLWYDNNVNNAAQAETVAIPAFGNRQFRLNQRPIGSWVARTGGRVRWRHPLTPDGRLLLETRASAVRNTALGATDFSQTWLTLTAGPRLGYAVPLAGRARPGRLAADVGVERRWWGGMGFATSIWGRLEVDQALTANWRVGLAPRVWGRFHDNQPRSIDPAGWALNLSVSRRAGPGWLTLDGTLSREHPGRRDLRWSSQGLSLQYAATVGEHWSGSVQVGLSQIRFAATDEAFLRRRADRTPTAGLTLSHRRISWNGYLPVLILNWARTTSNIPLYDRKLLSVRLGLQRLF